MFHVILQTEFESLNNQFDAFKEKFESLIFSMDFLLVSTLFDIQGTLDFYDKLL